MTLPLPDSRPAMGRDLRLDAIRGLCLVMIFINHIPGNFFERFTSRNFGFSDAAEGFVFMSGVAAGLAYSPLFRAGFGWQGVGRVWKRAWTLYLVHITTTMAALGILCFGALHLNAAAILSTNNFGTFLQRPLATFAAIPVLGFQLGYVNILPMYMVMLVIAPFMLWLALRRPMLLWALSWLVWATVGVAHINLPNSPHAGGWFFNPLSWQLIFCTGLLTGVALKAGRRLVPVWRWLQVVTGLYLLLALLVTMNSQIASQFGTILWQIEARGVPTLFTMFDKTYASAVRLLHILALAYFLSCLPIVTRIAGSRLAAPLVLLGRHSLPVFATGSLLALCGQVVKTALPPGLALDSALILGGLTLHFALAWALENGRLRPLAR